MKPISIIKQAGFSQGLAAVKLNGKWGFIDKTGKVIIEHQYDSAISFYEGLAEVRLDGKFGSVDLLGEFHDGRSSHVIDPSTL